MHRNAFGQILIALGLLTENIGSHQPESDAQGTKHQHDRATPGARLTNDSHQDPEIIVYIA